MNKKYIYYILYCFCSVFAIKASAQTRDSKALVYPSVVGEKRIDIRFGQVISDAFCNLERLEEKEIQNWFHSQDSLAEAYFAHNDNYQKNLVRFSELQNFPDGNVEMIRINESGNYFYLKHDEHSGVARLFFRQDLLGNEREIFNPAGHGTGDLHINYISPSYDGKKVAIGFPADDGFSSRIILYDLDARELLKEEITNINPDFGGIEWLPDSSGFIYLYFPVVEKSEAGYKKESFSVIHKLGDDPGKRHFIFGKTDLLNIPSNFYPKVKIGSSRDKYIIGYSASSGDYYNAYIASVADILEGTPNWKPFFKEKDRIYYNQGEVRGNEFIFRQESDGGTRLAKVDIADQNFSNPKIIATGSMENPIKHFEVTKNKIYYTKSLYGAEVSIFVIEDSNEMFQIYPPFSPGYSSFFGGSVVHNNIGIVLDGWTSDYTRYIIKKDRSIVKELLQNHEHSPEFDGLRSEQIMVKSHDGVEVPFSIVYKEGTVYNSSNEVFMYVYGAYGENMSPFYSPIFLDWVLQGGILAFPHVRGGGEKGKDWHIQGMKNLKYNSWKDLNACAEALIKRGLTRRGLIALYTSSAGGITAGMAVNERPDLYSSFIAEVPRMHPLGLESSSTASSTSYLEYGTVKDSLEFHGLIKMDPYLNIKVETHYPATLIMPSFKDDRIPLWDSGKYVARLQSSNIADTPVLMDTDYESGHESGGTYDETVQNYSKIFSFAKSNMKREPRSQ